MLVAILIGRNWQDVPAATRVLGTAAYSSKMYVQDFVESDGRLSVLGCVKADSQAIESRAMEPFDYLLVLDDKIDLKDMLNLGKEKSVLIINSREKPGIKKKDAKIFYVDATGISITVMLKPDPYPALLGAFTRIFGKLPTKSVRSFDEGFKSVKKA